MKNTLKALSVLVNERRNLTLKESSDVFDEIMDGRVCNEILAAFLSALKYKGECVDEVVGAATAMRARATFISSGESSPIDTCGTGGDGLNTFNISTTAAFITAGAGVSVAKHGNRGASAKSGSADVLARLGFNLDADTALMEHCLQENGIGAAWMPEWLRKLLGRMFPTLVLAADIHDIRYEIGGKKLNRLLDDVEMLDNGIRLANYSYRFFDPRRYVVQFVMLQFYIKLRDYGSLAFNTQEDENA